MLTNAIIFVSFDGTGVPDWVRLMPKGTFRPASASDRRGPFVLSDLAGVIAATEPGLPLLVDEDHVSLQPGVAAPARGWIVELQARDDGLYGRVEWTETGRALVAERAYRGFSPVFTAGKGGVVEKVLSLSLTNSPALPELNMFHSERNHTVEMTVALRQALGLPDTADDAAILARVTETVAAMGSHTTGLTGLASAAGIASTGGSGAMFVALRERLAGNGDVATLTAQVRSLETALGTMRQGVAQAAAGRFVDDQIKAGKPINALREHYIKRHIVDAASVETELNALASINAGGMTGRGEGGGGEIALTAVDREVIERMMVDPKAYQAEVARQAGLRQAAGGAR